MKPIITIDFETDPFEIGVVPKPFVAGCYDGKDYHEFWGEDCAHQLADHLREYAVPSVVYAHNGGKFDFYFMLDLISGSCLIINRRIVKATLGIHELRDSYAASPIPLSKYKKDDIDYSKLHRDVRNKHRAEISRYLQGDCVYLHEMMTAYRAMFGDKMTVGSAALSKLKEHHKYDRGGEGFDKTFRQFYAGGRNQCFETGVLKGDFSIYDMNSAYPASMRNMKHPVGIEADVRFNLTEKTDFAIVEAINHGALWQRTENGIDFTKDRGTFFASIHEINAGLDTGTLKILRVVQAIQFKHKTTFAEFVDLFYTLRNEAKANGELLLVEFYKFILNSAYGKFATNPENFMDYWITRPYDIAPDDSCESICDRCTRAAISCRKSWSPGIITDTHTIWERPSSRAFLAYHNVATAASITGGTRAMLLRGLAAAKRPIYCDTDSIICEDFHGDKDSKRLGAWKLEASCDKLAIAGKKLYAAFKDGEEVKIASKGARVTAEEIEGVAEGGETFYQSAAPTFRFDGETTFIKRRIRSTGVAHQFGS